MSQQLQTWMDQLLNKQIAENGTPLPSRPTINFLGGSVVDNPGNESTDISISAITPGQANVTLANGRNSNVATSGLGVVRVAGPTAAYSIDGFSTGATPSNGFRFVLVNTVNFPLTIAHLGAGSSAANRIDTLRGVDITLPASGSSAAFVWDSAAGRWALEHIGSRMPFEINVRDFGAKGDSSTDDTLKITAAISAAVAAGGGVIYFPAGKYVHTSTITIPSGVTLEGTQDPYYPGGGQPLSSFLGSWLVWGGSTTGVQLSIFDANRAGIRRLGVHGQQGAVRSYAQWQLGHVYATGAIVTAVRDNLHAFQLTSAGGTSGGSEPSWNTTAGGTTTDGTLTWTEIGQSALYGLYVHSDNSPPTSDVRIDRCFFAEQGRGLVVGNTGSFSGGQTDAENDNIIVEQTGFSNYAIAGITAASVNAFDQSTIRTCRCIGSVGSIGIDLQRCGLLTIEDTASGGNGLAFLAVAHSACDTVIVRNCETEPPVQFFVLGAGANDIAPLILEGNSIFVPCQIGSAVVVGIGNLVNGTSQNADITVVSNFGRWISYGDRFVHSRLLPAAGVTEAYHLNQEVAGNASAFGNYWNTGHVLWSPVWGAALGYAPGVAGEIITRSGWRGAYWAAGTATSVGDTVIAVPDNGRAFQAIAVTSDTLTGGSQPSWNLGTTIAIGSNGAILPQGSISVVSTTGFPPTGGTLYVRSTSGVQTVTYTGTTGSNTFTGCSGGVGALATGDTVDGAVTADNHVTWIDLGASAQIAPFAPLNHDIGAAIPTTGDHVLGAVHWNSVPATGQPVGWVCTAAGNPGTWAAFGAVGSAIVASTGTGLWHGTTGTLDAAASHGAADQLIGMNHAGTDISWFTAGGSVSVVSGAVSVLGVDGAGGSAPIHCNALSFDSSLVPVLTQAQAASTSVPQTLAFQCQQPGASASSSANGTPGGYSLTLPAPVAGGGEGYVEIIRASGLKLYQGAYPASPTAFTGIWIGLEPNANPNKFIIVSNGSSTYYGTGDTGTMHFVSGATSGADLASATTSGWVFFSQTFSLGGGVGVVQLPRATTSPTTNPSTGNALIFVDAATGALDSIATRNRTGWVEGFGPIPAGSADTQKQLHQPLAYTGRTTTNSGAGSTVAIGIALPNSSATRIRVVVIARVVTAGGTAAVGDQFCFETLVSAKSDNIGTITSTPIATPLMSLADTSQLADTVTFGSSGANQLTVTGTQAGGSNTAAAIDWEVYIDPIIC